MEEGYYDLVVIGAGPGGYEAALRAAKLGLKTAIVEKDQLGGTCLNKGCIPTKTLIYASELYRKSQVEFEELGISAEAVSYDIKKMHARKERVLEKLRSGVEHLLKSAKIDIYYGFGQVENQKLVNVHRIDTEGNAEDLKLNARFILAAVGARPAKPPIPGADLTGVVTSDELLEGAEQVPSRLLIIGGGVIGMEFASIYNALGCEVTVVEMETRILPAMDREISQNLTMIMKKRGIKIHTGAKVEKITEGTGGALHCEFTIKEQLQDAEADQILISIGRKADTEGIFPKQQPKLDHGKLVVDDHYETSMAGVYAIGDAIGGIQLAHLATAEGITAVEGLAGAERSVDMSIVPSCIFTDPEIAAVGLTADQAKERGIAAKTCKASMLANGKSIIENQERGFIKLVYDAESDVILGAQLMCARATDLVAELGTAIASGLTRKQLASVIRPHPTFCEGVSAAARD